MSKLDDSPYADDLSEEPVAGPAKGVSKLTLALVAGVVLVAGVLIGIQAQKTMGAPAVAAGSPQQGRGRQGVDGGPQRTGGQQREGGQRMPGGGGGTTGTVEKVTAGKVYLKSMDGSTVTVTTTDETTVDVATRGSVSDLKAGSTVTVRGERGEDGSVSATAITQLGGGR